MAGMPGIVIKVAADTRDAIQGLGAVDKALGKTSSAGQKAMAALDSLGPALGGAILGAGAALAAKGIATSIEAASALSEQVSKSKQVFGLAEAQVRAWAQTSVKSFGLSQKAATEAASTFAQFGKGAGLAGKKLADFSTDLVELAADMASFNDTSIEDAITAIGAGLRGESEPLRAYGVMLDDVTLKAQAFKMGLYSGSGALSQNARVLAAQAEILAQTSDQAGDFGRTSRGLANSQRVLSAAVEDATATIGTGFLNATLDASDAIGGASGLADRVDETATTIADLTRGVGLLVDELNGYIPKTADAAEGTKELEGEVDVLGTTLANSEDPLSYAAYLIWSLGHNANEAAADVQTLSDRWSGVAQAALDAQAAQQVAAEASNALQTSLNWQSEWNTLDQTLFSQGLAKTKREAKAAAAAIKAAQDAAEAKREREAKAREAKAKAKAAAAKRKAEAEARAEAAERLDELWHYVPFDPVRYSRARQIALRRADGRAAQRDARTGSRP